MTKVLEVFAYYRGEKGGEADHGTRLRFVQTVPGSGTGGEVGDGNGDNDGDNDNDGEGRFCALPGLEPVHAVFDSTCLPAYFDHWVSNGEPFSGASNVDVRFCGCTVCTFY